MKTTPSKRARAAVDDITAIISELPLYEAISCLLAVLTAILRACPDNAMRKRIWKHTKAVVRDRINAP
jgi:hypothetical protein